MIKRFALGLAAVAQLAGSAFAGNGFVVPHNATVYASANGGSAGGVSAFGTGDDPATANLLMTDLPRLDPQSQVNLGHFSAGQELHFAVRTTWRGSDSWAFSSSTDDASLISFTDPNNSLGLGGGVYEQTGPRSYLAHFDDATSFAYDDDDNDVLIGIRLCIADMNGDGLFDLSDVTFFVGAFVLGDSAADVAEPFGILDLADIVAFVEDFTSGCW